MSLAEETAERRRRNLSEFLERHLEPEESPVATLPWARHLISGSELRELRERDRDQPPDDENRPILGDPLGLAVTADRVLVWAYPPMPGTGKSLLTTLKAVVSQRSLKRGLVDMELPPDRLEGAYRKERVVVRDVSEKPRLNWRDLELEYGRENRLRLRAPRAFFDDLDAVAGELSSPGSAGA